MSGMLRVLMGLFAAYGLDVFTIGLICFLFWKLFTNHLAHITQDLKANHTVIGQVKKSIGKLNSRVSHIEGQLDGIKK